MCIPELFSLGEMVGTCVNKSAVPMKALLHWAVAQQAKNCKLHKGPDPNSRAISEASCAPGCEPYMLFDGECSSRARASGHVRVRAGALTLRA